MKHQIIASFETGMATDTDSNVLPMRAATYTYNFDTRRGALTDGIGLEPIKLGEVLPSLGVRAEGVWQYTRSVDGERDDRLVAYADGDLYSLPLYGARIWTKLDARFEACPTAINYRLESEDVLILCSAKDSMHVLRGERVETIERSPSILSMCVHYERLWAVTNNDRDCVWFSSDLDPTVWDISLTGAGFISMPDERGRAVKVVSFLDYVYVFREYGITRLTGYADQTQFAVSHLFTSSGFVYGDTVCLCGDRILFAAGDGLYSFDGLQTVKILTHLTFTLDARSACAAFADGKYYLSAKFDFLDGCGSVPVLLVADLANGETQFFRGEEIIGLARVGSGEYQAVAALSGRDGIGQITRGGAVWGTPTQKVWATPYTDLGRPDQAKVLNSLTVHTRAPLTVTVNRDGTKERYELNGGDAPSRVRLRGKAYRVGFVFESDSTDNYISRPILEFSV